MILMVCPRPEEKAITLTTWEVILTLSADIGDILPGGRCQKENIQDRCDPKLVSRCADHIYHCHLGSSTTSAAFQHAATMALPGVGGFGYGFPTLRSVVAIET